MQILTIHSHLTSVRVIRRISTVSSEGIRGESVFHGAPLFAGLEAMAQLAALHVRQRLQFERHAFLLKVYFCRMPNADQLNGGFRIDADLRSQSSNAFQYNTSAQGPDGLGFKGDLLIGTREYDDHFSKDLLKVHYQRLWHDLKE